MNKITSGRAPKATKAAAVPSQFIIMLGAGVCALFLAVSLMGKPAPELTIDSASAAVSAKLSENDAVAVFLGLDKQDDAVYVGSTDEDIYIDAPREPRPWSLWGYMADLIRGLLPDELK